VRNADVKPWTAVTVHDPHATSLSRCSKDTRSIAMKSSIVIVRRVRFLAIRRNVTATTIAQEGPGSPAPATAQRDTGRDLR
jgi:hypothetical protein